MHWYANQTSTTFIAKIDRLNRFDQSLVPNFYLMLRLSWRYLLCLSIWPHLTWWISNVIGCGMVSSTILVSAFGARPYFLHCMRVYVRPFSVEPPVKMKYRLFQSTQNKTTNTSFVLSIGLVDNSLIFFQFWNSMLNRYAIRNFRVAVLISPMKLSPCFHNSPVVGTDAKYGSAQMILSVLAHGIKSSFRTFVPRGVLYSSSPWSSSFLAELTNYKPHHNPQLPACRILDLLPILRLPDHCHIHCQTQIDLMTTMSIPPWYGLIRTYEIRRREELCVILIKMSNEVFNKFPPMSLMARTLTSHI